jgi:predicted porin
MLLGKYANGPLTLYAGYEWIRFAAPSDPQVAFTDVSGDFVCLGCTAINGTNINNTAYGVNGLGDRILQSMWIGAKYAVTKDVDVIGGYYRYIQNSFFGTVAVGPIYCADASHAQCAGNFDAVSFAVDWRFAPKWDAYFGVMFSQETGGLANGYLQRNNIDPTVGVRFRF